MTKVLICDNTKVLSVVGVHQEGIAVVIPIGQVSFSVEDSSPVGVGYSYTLDAAGNPTFTPPPPATTTTLKAVLWYNCFTPQEAIGIKTSTDPVVQEFWFRLQQLITAGHDVDTSLASVQEGVQYLVNKGIVAAPRVAAILLGTLT